MERKRGYVIIHQGHEDDYYEECSICHNKDVSIDDNFCSNCGTMFYRIKNKKSIENKLEDTHEMNLIEDPKEFTRLYCYGCGSLRCEGVGTPWFEGCRLKKYLKDYEKFYGDEGEF